MVPCFPLLGLTPSGLFMGLSSTIIYTSELILCPTICVPSATWHNIHMYLCKRHWLQAYRMSLQTAHIISYIIENTLELHPCRLLKVKNVNKWNPPELTILHQNLISKWTYVYSFTAEYKKTTYRKDSCISRTFMLKFWAKNRRCGLYTRPFLSERVNWLVVVTNWTENLQ